MLGPGVQGSAHTGTQWNCVVAAVGTAGVVDLLTSHAVATPSVLQVTSLTELGEPGWIVTSIGTNCGSNLNESSPLFSIGGQREWVERHRDRLLFLSQLGKFEQRFGMSSRRFWQLWRVGDLLGPDSSDFSAWAVFCDHAERAGLL